MMDAVDDTRPSDGERYRSARSSEPFLGPGARWLYVIAGCLLAGLGLGTIGYMAVTMATGGADSRAGDGPVPYVSADEQPYKTRPEDPGGMDIPNRDKHIYGVLRGEDVPNVERLLAQPEQPMQPPMVSATTTDAADPSRPPMETATAGDAGAEAPAAATADAPRTSTASSVATLAEQTPTALENQTDENRPFATAVIVPQPRPASVPSVGSSGNDRAGANSATSSGTVTTAPAPSSYATASAATTGTRGTQSGSQTYRVQLIALRSQEQAEHEWQRLVAGNRDLLGSLRPEVAQANLGSRGTVYRLRAGPVASEAAARTLCKSLADRKVGCLVIAPGA